MYIKNAHGNAHSLAVLHQLCPHHPAWLEVVSNLLARPMVINNPTGADKPSATWDGFPQGDEHPVVFHDHDRNCQWWQLRQLTSEVRTLSYVDDTVLIGAADAVNNALLNVPSLLRATGLELQPTKTQIWVPCPRAPLPNERPGVLC